MGLRGSRGRSLWGKPGLVKDHDMNLDGDLGCDCILAGNTAAATATVAVKKCMMLSVLTTRNLM